MSYILSPLPQFQWIDDHGNPLANGALWTYAAGTSTPLATYNAANGTANANPITLNAGGAADVWIDAGRSYKMVLKDYQGAIVWSVDNINSQGSGILSVTLRTIADLKALTVTTQAVNATVLGYYAVADGGGGNFYWSYNSSAPVDNGMVILSNSSATGRWLRIANGEINPRWYGAKGDNSTNDTPAMSDAADYAFAQSWPIHLTAGTYVLGSDPGFLTPVIFDSEAILKWASYGLDINPVISDSTPHFACQSGAWAGIDQDVTDIRPEWFGAEGDGSPINNVPGTNDTDAFTAAINSANLGCTILLSASKKYWVGPLVWREGINLKSEKPAGGDAYETSLILNEAGDLITLSNSGTGGLQGGEISGITLDGFNYTGNLLVMQTRNMSVHDCKFRNIKGSAIVLGGTVPLVNNRIVDNIISNCSGGITDQGNRTGNTGNIIGGNVINTTAGIYLQTVNGYSVTGNNITCDTFGLAAFNDKTGVATIGNNLITVTGDSAKGIAIVSSGSPSNLTIQNNTIYGTGTDTTGINTAGFFPGLISGNLVNGFTSQYDVDSSVALQYTTYDSTQATVFKSGKFGIGGVPATELDVYGTATIRTDASVGGNANITGSTFIGDLALTTTTTTAKLAAQNFNLLDSASGSSKLITAWGGQSDSSVFDSTSMVWDRESILRHSDGSDNASIVIRNGLGLDSTYNSPDAYKSWMERDLRGRTIWGTDGTQYVAFDSTSVDNCVGIISCASIYLGSSTQTLKIIDSIATSGNVINSSFDTIQGYIDMQINPVVPVTTMDVLRPCYNSTMNTNMQFINQVAPQVTGDYTATMSLNTFNIDPNAYVLITPADFDTFTGYSGTNIPYAWHSAKWAWGKVISYIGYDLAVKILYINGTPSASPSNYYVQAAFPFIPSLFVQWMYVSVGVQVNAAQITPIGFNWTINAALSYNGSQFRFKKLNI